MTPEEQTIITCAYLDLKGALEAFENLNYAEHDWKAHRLTIHELESTFEFLPQPDTDED